MEPQLQLSEPRQCQALEDLLCDILGPLSVAGRDLLLRGD